MIENYIADLYRTLLLREPSGSEIEVWIRASAEGNLESADLLRGFLVSGELPLALRGMINDTAAHRIVLDVGARGRERSNANDFLNDFGWKGLLVEANPALIPDIQAEFAGRDMTLVNVAGSD